MTTILTILLTLTSLAASPGTAGFGTVSVSGEGRLSAVPDIARVTIGVEVRRAELDAARSEVSQAIEALLGLTRQLEIAPEDVNATRVQIRPDYVWSEQTNEQRLAGYFVSRSIEVALHDLELLGSLIEGAADLGANSLGDPILDSSRRAELERRALELAVADARANAEVLAGAEGMDVGRALSIRMGGEQPSSFKWAMPAAAPPERGAAPYVAGEVFFSASVSIDYELVLAASD